MPMTLATMSQAARTRVKRPRTRGTFAPIDAARRQLGLLSVGDGQGQARIYWLVDLASGVIEDARFLAFGDLTSHAVADVFTEQVRGRTVADAGRLTAEQIEFLLREDPHTPAFAEDGLAPVGFIADLQARAEAELPTVRLLPKPDEQDVYQRKRRQDWTDEDRRWFDLSFLRRIGAIEDVIREVIDARAQGSGLKPTVEAVNDDFRVVLRLEGIPAEQAPTYTKFIEDALRDRLHRQITVQS